MCKKYLISIVCKDGHVVTARSTNGDNSNNKFCEKCGVETISSCESCGTPIRGDIDDCINFTASPSAPPYCYKCGSMFPWTAKRLKKLEILLANDIHLNDEEKEQLLDSAKGIMVEDISAQLDAAVYVSFFQKAKPELQLALRSFAVSVASQIAMATLSSII